MKEPIPSFEWIITYRCNYKCPYCSQANNWKYHLNHGHCSDKTIAAVFDLLPRLKGEWLIKLIGGEPLIHPRFFEICEKIVASGHRLCLTSNFSLPIEQYKKLINICGDKLASITASLHLSQVRDIDTFISKAAAFNNIKNPPTYFCTTTVMVEEEFDQLQCLARKLENEGVIFKFQPLKSQGKYLPYSSKVEDFLNGKMIKNTEIIRNKNLFGTLCHTGCLFFKIDVNGTVTRCYNMQPFYYLGNITNGTFRRFKQAKPCMARRCSCTVPANRNMIRFGSKAGAFNTALSCVQGGLRIIPYIATNRLHKLVHRFSSRRNIKS